MKRIGILGGTFNPIHIGHLAIAQVALQKLDLDKVIFVPCCLPPHKNANTVISAQDRLQMVRLATEENPVFSVSDYEIKKGGKSYSYYTVEHFYKKFHQGTKIYFIIGADALEDLDKWHRINDILKIATFVAVERKGSRLAKSNRKIKYISMPAIDISSSEIRRLLRAGESVKYLMPEKVIKFIKRKKLYID
jgi:nicotinate-nucleotide adenylyltransferase